MTYASRWAESGGVRHLANGGMRTVVEKEADEEKVKIEEAVELHVCRSQSWEREGVSTALASMKISLCNVNNFFRF